MGPPTFCPGSQLGARNLALVAMVIAAWMLRIWNCHESLWVDELHTAWCALGGLEEVVPRAAQGNQGPIFYWGEWLLVRVLGPSELSLRLPSLIGGTLLPMVLYFFARRWLSAGVGMVGAVMLTIDPMAIYYASEARPYALLQLLTVLHIWLLLAMFQRPTARRRCAWISLAAVLFYLHYTAALVLAAEVLFLGLAMVWREERGIYRWSQAMVDIAILALLCLPACGQIVYIFGRRDNWVFVKKNSPLAVFEWWPTALGGAYIAAAAFTQRTLSRNAAVPAILWIWLFVPTGIAWLATQFDVARLFFPRYLVAAQPVAVLFGAVCMTLAPWRWSAWLVGGLLLGASLWNSGIVERFATDHVAIAPRGEDWRGAVRWLNEQRFSRPLPVIVASGLIEMQDLAVEHGTALEDYCLYPVTSLYPLAADRQEIAPLIVDDQGHIAQVLEMLAVHRGSVWLVVRGDKMTADRIGRGLAAQLTQAESPAWRARSAATFPGVQLLLIEPQGPALGSFDLRP